MRYGVFKKVRPEVLGGAIVKELCRKYDIQGPDALLCGNAVGPGGNIGRLLALEGGLPDSVPALTLDLQCASGLAAIHMAALGVMTGEWDLVFAGGAESASLQPRRIYPENDERSQLRNPEFTAAQFIPGEYSDNAMLLGAERAAKKAGISRDEADEAALISQQRAKEVQEKGLLSDVILPFYGSSRDEAIRKRMSEKLLARAPRVTDFPEGLPPPIPAPLTTAPPLSWWLRKSGSGPMISCRRRKSKDSSSTPVTPRCRRFRRMRRCRRC